MERLENPALFPCLGILLGTLAGSTVCDPGPAGAALLLAAALTLDGPSRRFWLALALALWNVGLQPPGADQVASLFVPEVPVTVVGRVAGHPRVDGREIRALVRVEGIAQARQVHPVGFDLWVVAAAPAEPLVFGGRIRARGYLRRGSGYWNVPAIAPGGWRMRIKAAPFLVTAAFPGPLAQRVGKWRGAVEQRFDQSTGSAPAASLALARALLLGDRADLPPEWLQVLRRCGLAHLLAVSGLHMGLVALLVSIGGIPLPPPLRYGLVLAALVGYLVILGPRPSVLRAAVMGCLGFLALVLERPPRAFNALCCGVGALVWLDPSMLFDLGFQLSAGATAGILLLVPRLEDKWWRLPRFLRRPLAATVAAQVAVLAWTWPLEGGIHPLAVVGNLFAIPWLFGALSSSWLFLLATGPSPAFADFWLQILTLHTEALDAAARIPAHSLTFKLWYLPPAMAAGIAVCLLGTLWVRALPARGCFLAAGLLLLVVARIPPAGVELVMLDVGQGDAVVIRDGDRAVLIDGGGWPTGDLGGRVLAPALAGLGIDRLLAVVMTHPDQDHCGGLVDVTRYIAVEEVWMSRGWTPKRCVTALESVPGASLRFLEVDRRQAVGRWEIRVLQPKTGRELEGNDDSLVLLASAFGRRVLLTGDIEAPSERRLLQARARELAADVLKVAHHGSRTSTSATWLQAVGPAWALISAGRSNPYGHPAPQTLRRLVDQGSSVIRTDRSGQIKLRFSPGGHMAVELPAARPPSGESEIERFHESESLG